MNEERCVPTGSLGLGLGQIPMPENPTGTDFARDIQIFKVLNGFVVIVGCKKLVFESKDTMLHEIGRYYDNPQQIEKEYIEKYVR